MAILFCSYYFKMQGSLAISQPTQIATVGPVKAVLDGISNFSKPHYFLVVTQLYSVLSCLLIQSVYANTFAYILS